MSHVEEGRLRTARLKSTMQLASTVVEEKGGGSEGGKVGLGVPGSRCESRPTPLLLGGGERAVGGSGCDDLALAAQVAVENPLVQQQQAGQGTWAHKSGRVHPEVRVHTEVR